jgi:trigger factor
VSNDHDHDHDHDHENCGHDHDHDHAHGHGQQAGPAVATVVEDLGPCKKMLKIEVAASDVKKEIVDRLKQLGKNVHLKGFRKGKAPKARIEKLYGGAVRQEAREQLLRQGYMRAVKETLGEERVLNEGTIENVEFSEEEGLKFEVTLNTRPEFELPEYKGLKVAVPAVEVEDKHLEEAIDRFRRTRAELRPVEDADAVVEGEDLLNLDVQVWLLDEYETFAEAQEAGEETNLKPLKEEFGLEVQLPGNQLGPYFVEDLGDGLQGLKIGEWGEGETDLPSDYDVVEGRGEPAMLRLRVEAIRRNFLPDLTEEWVKEAGHDSIEDLRREMREELQHRAELSRRHVVEGALLTRLLSDIGEFDLPSDIIDSEMENAERRRTLELRIQEGKSEREAEDAVAEEREEIRTRVLRMLREFFVLDEISKREGVQVSDRDVQARVYRIAMTQGRSPDEVWAELEERKMLPQVRHDLLDEKTRTLLREHAEINDVKDED